MRWCITGVVTWPERLHKSQLETYCHLFNITSKRWKKATYCDNLKVAEEREEGKETWRSRHGHGDGHCSSIPAGLLNTLQHSLEVWKHQGEECGVGWWTEMGAKESVWPSPSGSWGNKWLLYCKFLFSTLVGFLICGTGQLQVLIPMCCSAGLVAVVCWLMVYW